MYSTTLETGLAVVKRDGSLSPWNDSRISAAIQRACIAVGTELGETTLNDLLASVRDQAKAQAIHHASGNHIPLETLQDIVERSLAEQGRFDVAKAYILYRAERNRTRQNPLFPSAVQTVTRTVSASQSAGANAAETTLVPFPRDAVETLLAWATQGMGNDVDRNLVLKTASATWFDAIPEVDLYQSLVSAASAFIEIDPAYDRMAARLEVAELHRTMGVRLANTSAYQTAFRQSIQRGVESGLYDPKMARFNLELLAAAVQPQRDEFLDFQGIRTLAERYLLRDKEELLELPQIFWMRVAMGLALREDKAEARAVEFYEVMSTLRFVPSTPTLFHAGLPRAQLSSCYLSYVGDDLAHIFKVFGDNAQLSKWSGGIGNDWTSVRATGANIVSTRVQSQGVIPFLKICNDATVAINRSGKRRGALCAYLESWHLDIEDFLDLRRNTGDDRRRTHDMNTSNWIPDLFMKRVAVGKEWTLFSPHEVPDLHELYGAAFDKRYEWYEERAHAGKLEQYKTLDARTLWRKMLSRLYETGHPWITFKDPCNIRSPQDHVGVVHNSNLCTEITLNNSADETAVCNLGSVNLAVHVSADGIDEVLLGSTVQTAMRMLDNVIELNFYPTVEAERSNLRHRPVGLGIMGFQDALLAQGLAFQDAAALECADRSMELVSWHAIRASALLAQERGTYESYQGSKWDRGFFPIDTMDLLEQERGVPIPVPRTSVLDWSEVRALVKTHGMRNSNCMAIAPTATISTIAGCYPSFEPAYKNLYVKSNMSGEFTILNHFLVDELKKRGLWNRDLLQKLKYHDGGVAAIAEIPADLKPRFAEAFAVDPIRLLEFTAVRGKWIDQSQSHNVFISGTSGALLDRVYTKAWELGLKTTYYLRTLGASQIEKSTLDASFGFTQKRPEAATSAATGEAGEASVASENGSAGASHLATATEHRASPIATVEPVGAAVLRPVGMHAAPVASVVSIAELDLSTVPQCRIDDPTCESCQ